MMIIFTVSYFIHAIIAKRHIASLHGGCVLCEMAHREHEDMALSDVI